MPIADLPRETTEIVGLDLIAGDSWTLIVQFYAETETDGVITTEDHDLSGVTTWLGEIEHSGGTITLTVGASDDPEQTLATGWVMMRASAAQTAGLTAQRAAFRLRATWAAFDPDYVFTLAVGEIQIREVW